VVEKGPELAGCCRTAWSLRGEQVGYGQPYRSCTLKLPKLGTYLCGKGVEQESIDNLIRHERAHCNGWSAHHPQE
jgi:hypothetical protein